MKIKNLAFFGIMASILGVSAANAAADNTVLTTKAYVDKGDTAAAATALQSAKTYVGTQLQAYTPTADLGDLALLDEVTGTDIADDANIAKTQLASDVQASLGKADSALQSADISGLASETYVNSAIGALDAEVNATENKVVTGVVETDGKITGVNAALITSANIASNANIAATQLSTAVQSALTAAGTALQSGNNVSLLNNDAGYQNSTQVGTAIDTKIATLDAEINKEDGTVLTGVTEADGKITAVASTKIANANVADNAAIATTKLAAPAVDLNNEAYTCPAGARCVVTYKDGHYSLTPMNTVADETTGA